MPNDTDLTVFMGAGLSGLNFAYIGSFENYHSITDDLDHVCAASMRHHGVQALALARRLANTDDLSAARLKGQGDSVYFDVWSMVVVRYPARLAMPLAVVAAAMLAALIVAARRELKPRYALLGVAVMLLEILVCCVIVYCGIRLIARHAASARSFREVFPWFYGGSIFLTLLLTRISLLLFPGRAKMLSLFCGTMGLWVCLDLATSVWAPGASYLFFVPAVLACAAMLFVSRPRATSAAMFVVLLALCAVAASLNKPSSGPTCQDEWNTRARIYSDVVSKT